MAEFSAIANLEARVTQDSLRNARREIERELGDIEVGVSGSGRPTGRQPREPGSGRFMSQRGPEQRLIDLIDLATQRNDLLEDILEEGAAGGGGGAVGAAAGVGIAARFGGLAALSSPFGGLALGTLGLGALALSTDNQDGTGGPGPGPEITETTGGDIIRQGRRAAPPPGSGPDTTRPPDRSPLAGGLLTDVLGPDGTIRQGRRAAPEPGDQTTNIENTVNVQVSDSQRQSEIRRFVQAEIRQTAERIKQEIERDVGGGTTGRTTPTGGGTSGARLR